MPDIARTEFVVPVQQSMNEILQVLGDPQIVAMSALRRYLVDVCWQRIEQAERQIAEYEQKYQTTYETFGQQVSTDETFLDRLNQKHPTWEADAIEWDYRLEELQTWRNRLEKILHESSPSLAQS
jgi:hypothetical protein